jgi:glyoxylase-like metal-dependent hydrolase (beta-lactamase superfamily II)
MAAQAKKTTEAAGGTPRCTVRMYCHGLGDCFLVSIPRSGERPFWLMVDAGVLLGTSDAPKRMAAVFESILKATGGQIDLLIVTHQHWDHVSGFAQAQEAFAKLKVQKVWYAWTEDPNDPLGVELQRTRSKAAFAVEQALARMDEGSSLRQGISELMGAFGVGAGGTGSLSTVEAMKVPGASSLTPAEYRKPGQTVDLGSVRFHILGPPRDERIFRSDPSKKTPEVYESGAHKVHAFGLGQSMGMIEAVEGIRSDAANELTRPFDARHCRKLEDMPEFYPNYADKELAWRTIDKDWMGIVGQLALQLDSDTNNTSLVFAIEIPETGKVLLFAADAQVGNWLSWHDVQWKFWDGEAEQTLKASDLLNRTVFYKVGHHGSHNATLREKGLEMMISPDLCAMIPVDVEMARKKKWMEMPLDTLLARLREKTGGRVAKADDPSTFAGVFRASEELNEFVEPKRPLFVELDVF